MKIGYARVSLKTQSLDMQIDALENIGCEKIFLEKASGAKRDRPELKKALSLCKEGDSIIVWKLDRLARSTKQLVETIEDLEKRNVKFVSLTEEIDTSGAVGRFIFNIFASLAQFERDIIRERVLAGLAAAKRRGNIGGRPKVFDENKMKIAKKMLEDDEMTIKDICQTLNISIPTLYRYIKGGRGAIADCAL